MTAFLPQHDPQPANRADAIEKARKKYQFNYDYVCPLALVDEPPYPDEYSMQWSMDVASKSRDALLNVIELEDDSAFRSTFLDAAKRLTKALTKSQFDQHKFFMEILAVVVDAADDTKLDSMLDHASLFRRIGLPPVCRYYNQDRMFANQRVAGPNPVMLQRMSEPDARIPLTEAHFSAAIVDDSLEAAMAEGRLFMCDYHMLEAVEPGSYPRRRKYVYAPIAVFAAHKTTGELQPVAIQCEQNPGAGNPIFTPQHGWNWQIAKLIVEVADGNVHQTVSHLGRTHLFVEPFAVVTKRQLADQHPISVLLSPHFEGTMHINYMAHKALIAPRNIVDRVLAGTIESSGKLTVWGLTDYTVADAMLPTNLKGRGVDDATTLKNYPFRDDSLLYWNAIRDWVDNYLAAYYPNEGDLLEDRELQNWCAELAAQDGGRVVGMPAQMESLEKLRDILTLVIFKSSVQHAAVNFPQVDLLSYVPNMPLAGYTPRPTSTEGATEKDLLDMLPPKDQELVQLTAGQMLGRVHYNQLGQYAPGHFDDTVKEPLNGFRGSIDRIGDEVAQRNLNRHPYVYLTPPGIPQSINI